ncbi:MAG: rod shape-determining protein MreD [Anaerolineales bacterium]|nr:rod shape-determining protein MreD [Anaerolineales bacterium]
MSASVYVAFPLMALLGVLQTAVLPHFPILGQVPVLPFLVALAWGLLRGVNEGAVWAFMAGFWQDMFSIVPLGTHALVFLLAITAVLLIQQLLPLSQFLLPALFATIATILYLILHTMLLRLLGFSLTLNAVTSLLPIVILHAIIILPIYWLMNQINRRVNPRRVEL